MAPGQDRLTCAQIQTSRFIRDLDSPSRHQLFVTENFISDFTVCRQRLTPWSDDKYTKFQEDLTARSNTL